MDYNNVAGRRAIRSCELTPSGRPLFGVPAPWRVRIAKAATISAVLLLASCTLFNPYVRSDLLDCRAASTCGGSKGSYAGGAAAAIDAAEDQRKRYLGAASAQYIFNASAGLAMIGLSADAIYKGVSSNSTSPNLPLTALAVGAAGLYGADVWLHNKPAEAAYIVGFQAITCTMLRSRAILMTQSELDQFESDANTLEADITAVDLELSKLQIAWDLGDEAQDVWPTEKADLKRETGNVIRALARARKLLLTARAYDKEVLSSGQTIRGQVNLVVANVSAQVAPSEPSISTLKGLLGIFGDPSKGVADLQAVTVEPATSVPVSPASPAAPAPGKPGTQKQPNAAAAGSSQANESKTYEERAWLRKQLWTSVSTLYADGRKLNSVLASAQNFYESTRKISACTPAGTAPPLEITPASVSAPVPSGSVLKFNISGGAGIPEVALTGSTGSSADAKTPDLSVGVNGNSLIATVTILPGASGTLTLTAIDKGSPAQSSKVTIDVEESSSPSKPTFMVQPGNGSAQISFTTPSAKGGTLSGYTLTVTLGNATPVTLKLADTKQGTQSTGSKTITATISSATASDTTIEITGLTNGQKYTLGLTANFNGAADEVFESADVTPTTTAPPAPKWKVLAGDGNFQLSFPTPAAKTAILSGYTLTLSEAYKPSLSLKFPSPKQDSQAIADTARGKISSVTASITTITVAGLSNGTDYDVGLVANFNGAADQTLVSSAKVTPAAPKK